MVRLAQIFIAILISCVSLLAQEPTAEGKEITIETYNADSDEGMVFIALYNKEDHFLKKPVFRESTAIANGKSEVVFKNILPGVYAVSVYHDENNNGKLDTNFIGVPKEATGTSNNAPARFGPPKWKDAKFEVKNEAIKLKIKL